MRRLYLILSLLLLLSCRQSENIPTRMPTAIVPDRLLPLPPTPILPATLTPNNTAVLPPTTTAVPPSTPANKAWRVQVTTAVPYEIRQHVHQLSQTHPDKFRLIDEGEADIRLAVNEGQSLANWLYVPVAPFVTITDEITLAELQAGQSDDWSLLLGENSAAALGVSAPTLPDAALVDELWAQRPSRAILPFSQLTPDLKLLRLDGVSPLDEGFNLATYPLTVKVGLSGNGTAVADLRRLWQLPASNYDPHKLTHVAMTGVLALVRATAYQMELNGVSYPGTDVAPILQAADIAHVSNEVAFAADCPYPNPVGGTTFCSRDPYFQLIQEIGVDVVELTGNHINDWGTDNFLRTIDMYETADMAYFGGGRDLEDASRAAFFEHNGNKIAFVGCNSFGPVYAWADGEHPGSRPCNDAFYTQIGELATAGWQVIATLQYTEFYHYAPTAQQQLDFERVIDAGATAVSGSQGHHAQSFAFHNGGFIHFGLGNLFFDQMDMLGTRQTFIDTYTFYDNRLIHVDLWVGLIENWAKPRPATAEERAQALTAVFQNVTRGE